MASGAIWTFTGTAIAKLIVLIAGILCARILGKELYGEFGMVRSTINMFVVLGTAGLGMTATKYISEYRKEHKDKVASIYILTNRFALITGLIVSALVIMFADKIAITALNSPQLVVPFKFGAILLLVTILLATQNGVLYGLEDFKSVAINTFIGSIFETIFMLLGAYYYGVMGAVIGFGCGFVSQLVVNKVSIRRSMKEQDIDISKGKLKVQEIKLLYKFSLPAMLSSMLIAPTFWLIRTMLVNESGYGELAIYEAADQWKIILLAVPAMFAQILLPILSSVVNVDKNKYWILLKINLVLNVLITFCVSIIVMCFSKKIMLSYGEEFSNETTLNLIVLSTIFTSLANVVGTAIASRSKMWIGFCFNLLWSLLVLLLTYYFLRMGMNSVGVGMAILISYLVHSILQLIYLYYLRKKEYKIIQKNYA